MNGWVYFSDVRMLKDGLLAHIKVVPQNLLLNTEESNEKSQQDSWSLCRELKPGYSDYVTGHILSK
jgi:hypothetical protein